MENQDTLADIVYTDTVPHSSFLFSNNPNYVKAKFLLLFFILAKY